MENLLSTAPKALSRGENVISNRCEIANVFSNHFGSVADTAKQNISYSHKHFPEYVKHECDNSIFIQPTGSEEIANIISSLNISKASDPFSIPNKILILLKKVFLNNLQSYLIFLFHLGFFHLYLKLPR